MVRVRFDLADNDRRRKPARRSRSARRARGRELALWITAHYRTTRIFGDPPLQDGSSFGIAVLRRGAARPPS